MDAQVVVTLTCYNPVGAAVGVAVCAVANRENDAKHAKITKREFIFGEMRTRGKDKDCGLWAKILCPGPRKKQECCFHIEQVLLLVYTDTGSYI